MKPRISMITLGVEDMPRAIRFYEEGLSLPRRESPPQVAFFTLNGTWLGLYGRDDLAADAGVAREGNGFRSVALAHNLGSAEEVDALFSQALSAGGTAIKQPTQADWGGYSGYFADPDGHLWEVAYNPAFWVGPEDSSS